MGKVENETGSRGADAKGARSEAARLALNDLRTWLGIIGDLRTALEKTPLPAEVLRKLLAA
jgi:hypothetical protein